MENMDNIPHYRTLVLGTEGSGKTVFMASMYQYLAIQHTETGFYLRTTPIQHRDLTHLYQVIRDPDSPWPATTTKVEEWDFLCCVESHISRKPVFSFTYYDYPGEVLTEEAIEGSQVLQDFEQKAQMADTRILILDGEKIRAWLNDGFKVSERKTNIMQDLDFMLRYLQDGLKPTHFVVTKWDLLDEDLSPEQSNHTLDRICSALMENRNFHSIVMQLNQAGMPARLIPVSAVGKNFATLDANGNMQKTPKALPVPYQVEMPIALTLIDAFHAEHVRLSPEQRVTLQKVLSSKLWSFFISETELLERLPILPKFKLSRQVLSLLIEIVEVGLREKSLDSLLKERDKVASKLKNKESAMKLMVLNYAVLAKRLLNNYPASDLNSGEK